MSACWPGMFADLTDEQVWDMLMSPVTACEEQELAREAAKRGLLGVSEKDENAP